MGRQYRKGEQWLTYVQHKNTHKMSAQHNLGLRECARTEFFSSYVCRHLVDRHAQSYWICHSCETSLVSIPVSTFLPFLDATPRNDKHIKGRKKQSFWKLLDLLRNCCISDKSIPFVLFLSLFLKARVRNNPRWEGNIGLYWVIIQHERWQLLVTMV